MATFGTDAMFLSYKEWGEVMSAPESYGEYLSSFDEAPMVSGYSPVPLSLPLY